MYIKTISTRVQSLLGESPIGLLLQITLPFRSLALSSHVYSSCQALRERNNQSMEALQGRGPLAPRTTFLLACTAALLASVSRFIRHRLHPTTSKVRSKTLMLHRTDRNQTIRQRKRIGPHHLIHQPPPALSKHNLSHWERPPR